jgi:hypothetical protein
MAANDKGQGSHGGDQGAKKEIAGGMSESGKSGGDTGTGTQPKRTGSDELAQGMSESGSGKPTGSGSGSAKH